MQFIGELSEFRPGTPERGPPAPRRIPPPLQQAAEKLVKLEKDPKSEARQAATFILLNNRTRWIAQADPHAQKQTIVDVAAYLKNQGAKGPGEVAARLANSLGETLKGMENSTWPPTRTSSSPPQWPKAKHKNWPTSPQEWRTNRGGWPISPSRSHRLDQNPRSRPRAGSCRSTCIPR